MSQLYRLVYTSRNLVEGSETELGAEVTQILATSRRNNTRADVTGALLFNKGAFAQVLEGPRSKVEETFERIQRDTRHSDVTVLECAPTESRSFPDWSMAFVGHSAKGQALWSRIADRDNFDHSRLDADEVFAVLRTLLLEEESQTDEHDLHPSGPNTEYSVERLSARANGAVPNFEAIRAELQQVMHDLQRLRTGTADLSATSSEGPARSNSPEPSPNRGHEPVRRTPSPDVEASILRQALMNERQRTSDLRGELDDLQALLLTAHQRIARLEVERNLWAERVRLAALALCADPAEATLGVAPLPQALRA